MNRVSFLVIVVAVAAAFAQEKPAAVTSLASQWNDRGLDAADRQDYVEAERAYQMAIQEWKALGPNYDAHLATTLMNLAQSYTAQGKRREGAAAFEESLGKYRRTVGVRNERALMAMNLLGAVYLMLWEGSKAEPLFLEALPIEREIMPNSIQLARSLGGLATISLYEGKLDAALVQAEEALKVAIAAEGEISLDAALGYATAGEIHRIARRRDRALPLYRKSRFIYEKLLGPEHTRVASLLSQEGLILMADGKYSLAEKNMTRSLEIVKKACPGCAYELWVGECNLGMLRLKQKRYAEADELLSHSLEMQEKHSRQPNVDMVGTIQALAIAREKLRRFEDADRLMKRAALLKSYR